ncbi:unnamed protein product [Pleuronectes platessa]|uniref:Uncharacterized protein n=1 Tax=Pleuronectes platessa TaxID=8262 RepID=A0A9N7V4B4_PLEPL|nr:unnamed protein product [Pleuronectes platessa]
MLPSTEVPKIKKNEKFLEGASGTVWPLRREASSCTRAGVSVDSYRVAGQHTDTHIKDRYFGLCGAGCDDVKVSPRSEASQREEDEVVEADDVTMQTHQTHLPWVQIPRFRREMEGYWRDPVKTCSLGTVSTEAPPPVQAPEPLVLQPFKDKM